MAKKALGKGLGALIKQQDGEMRSRVPESKSKFGVTDNNVVLVALDKIVPSPLQPRRVFTDDQLDDLMESIKYHGVIQPLITREVDGKLELIAGERRWRASQRLNLKEVPVIVRGAEDIEVLEMALIENLQREDLNPIEEAAGYAKLAKEFGAKQEEIAQRVGKSRAGVANSIRLLDLQPEVQQMVERGVLSVGHAKVILSEKDTAKQMELAERVIKKKLTVRAIEHYIKNSGGPVKDAEKNEVEDEESVAQIQQIEDQLARDFGTRVQIKDKSNKGKIEIEYFNKKDLHRVLELLGITF